MKDYHIRIKEIRERKRLTQEFLADSLKLTQRAYSSIENGQTQLTVERLFEIASILETPINDLIGNEGANIYNNNFNNNAPENHGNLIVQAANYQEMKDLYERIIAAKDSELEILKTQLDRK